MIPEGNIALTDEELTIRPNKTLVINGDMSTNWGVWRDDTGNKFQLLQCTSTSIHEKFRKIIAGTITNEGSIEVNGNLYTTYNRQNSNSETSSHAYGIIRGNRIQVNDGGNFVIFDTYRNDFVGSAYSFFYVDNLILEPGSRLNFEHTETSQFSTLLDGLAFSGTDRAGFYPVSGSSALRLRYAYENNKVICRFYYATDTNEANVLMTLTY